MPKSGSAIGLFPVVRNKAFDMVSDGTSFKLYLPAKNRFVVGRSLIATTSPLTGE